jgi:catechol 2,3-dioxygenase-like lactoylglutathione lyase family enzyme
VSSIILTPDHWAATLMIPSRLAGLRNMELNQNHRRSKPSQPASAAQHAARVQAIDHVDLEAAPGSQAALRWFYSELAGLACVEDSDGEAAVPLLRFRSERIELRIRLVERPHLEPVAGRVVLLVASLARAVELLTEQKMAFTRISGIQYTDRRLSLLDPAGNRVELKQAWPYGML